MRILGVVFGEGSLRMPRSPFFWMCQTLAVSVVAVTLGVVHGHAAPAPPQLRGKTVTASYSTSLLAKADKTGKVFKGGRSTKLTIYISGEGRMFVRRHTINSAKQTGAFESDPGKTPYHFEGGALVARTALVSGAVQTTIMFSPDYRSCTISVIIGQPQVGQRRWHDDINGEMYTAVSSTTISGESCSIAEGNGL
jgi:hypothetical protein